MQNHSTEQILFWINFDLRNWIESMKGDSMSYNIEISLLLRESMDGIKEVCIQCNKMNAFSPQFYVSCFKIKHLRNLVFHVKDMERIGKNGDFDFFSYIERIV